MVIGSLATNGDFLKEAFGFFDEVYVSSEIPNEEMAGRFLAKKPSIILLSIDANLSTRSFDYLEKVRASDPKIIIAILFFNDTSALSMRSFFRYNYDFYRTIEKNYSTENQFNVCLRSLINLYSQQRDT